MTTYQDPVAFMLSSEVTSVVQLILDRWQPSRGKRLLIALPCSASKPYRTSISQRLYLSAIHSVEGAEQASEVVTLSGVFGIVPRQFEDLPAVVGYDFSLNRSKDTLGLHSTIIDILSTRIATFLQRFGPHYKKVIFYGRDRYATAAARAAVGLPGLEVQVIGAKDTRLKKEGLKQLQTAVALQTQSLLVQHK